VNLKFAGNGRAQGWRHVFFVRIAMQSNGVIVGDLDTANSFRDLDHM
jgi:hypothetical protein